MTDKLEQSSDARSMQSTQEKEEQDALATPGPTAETEYPPLKTVLAIIAGMMCVSLLVALVSSTFISSPYSILGTGLTVSRTERSLPQRYQPSRITSTH